MRAPGEQRNCRACGKLTGRPRRAYFCAPCAADLRRERDRQRSSGRYAQLTEPQRERRRAYANDYARKRQLAYPERVAAETKASHKRRYDRGAAIIRAAKAGPCVDCGVCLPPAAMDLDHVRGEKLFSVCNWITTRLPKGTNRMDMLRDEIAKCDLRCPNCHRMRHLRDRVRA